MTHRLGLRRVAVPCRLKPEFPARAVTVENLHSYMRASSSAFISATLITSTGASNPVHISKAAAAW